MSIPSYKWPALGSSSHNATCQVCGQLLPNCFRSITERLCNACFLNQADSRSYVESVMPERQPTRIPSVKKQEDELKKGRKDDGEKPPLAYIPKAGLYAEGMAFKHGAKKYDAWNYKQGIAITRTLSAAIRHILQFLDGEDVDVESGANHLGCARANLSMALDTLEHHPELDDRYKGGKK